jgi:deoxyribodipyrimidine photo-lyase
MQRPNNEGLPPPPAWTPTRAAGLARLEAFLPRAGRSYERDRNVDRGPADRSNVSGLSPWLRRRMITEAEVITAVLARHPFEAAQKFVQEVFWRTYWKGWLEQRPDVLLRFEVERARAAAQAQARPDLRKRLEVATAGQTGIEAFDAWVDELVTTGWLHNHARMWFASIWIFTLKLPWQLGAAFMFDHLLDADPASNTLSWRWVAGLHTRGKHYLARADNIRDNTQGRFSPAGQLDERALPLSEEGPPPAIRPLPAAARLSSRRVGLLLHEDDLHPESLALEADIAAVAMIILPPTGEAQSPAASFARGADDDALDRAARAFGVPAHPIEANRIREWARSLGVSEIATPYAPAGRAATALAQGVGELEREGIRLVQLQRNFDQRAWPYATAGFFRFREQIPRLVAELAGT